MLFNVLDDNQVFFLVPSPLHGNILSFQLEPVIVTCDLRAANSFADKFPGLFGMKNQAIDEALTFLVRKLESFIYFQHVVVVIKYYV